MYKKLELSELVEFTKTLKVLYVEDNQEARDAFKSLMSNFFVFIDVACDGEEGLSKFEQNESSYDLIITDIRMPKMSGIDMIKKIKELDENISIIVSTAHKETELLIDCIKSGVNGYLLKPIGYNQISQAIKQVCEKIYYMKKNQEYENSLEKLVKARTKELEDAQEKLIDLANKDSLTSLYNRRYFNEISHNLMNIANREKGELSLLMIDIDKFKNINDRYGHLVGDIIIKEVSKCLIEITRDSDIVVRFGGEEFLIILPNTNIEGASLIAKKIRSTIENLDVRIKNNVDNIVKFSISIGVTQCNCGDGENIDSLVLRADEALYEAKRNGRNRVVIYEKKII